MSNLTPETISSSSDDELIKLLGKELESRISAGRESPEFVDEIRTLPEGLRAMAATYELDVSLCLDDLGWHFGNWHNKDLAEETIRGLEILGAPELALIFREAYQLSLECWSELGREDWSDWYSDSPLEAALEPLNDRATNFLEKHKNGIFHYWVTYARKHPQEFASLNA